ncbi:hypothetical protein LY76DRAFT_63697 [Colletotrichum caudatum]|nr:hypothetical protein LY76DRAFT_63697 [Colletotrichum caudatum]
MSSLGRDYRLRSRDTLYRLPSSNLPSYPLAFTRLRKPVFDLPGKISRGCLGSGLGGQHALLALLSLSVLLVLDPLHVIRQPG